MSELKLNGTITKVLEVEKGTSKAGKEWQKQSFVIDTGDQYNPEVCFQLFGEDKIQMLNGINTGDKIEVSFNLSSREYKGRYFHNVDAWKINKTEAQEPAPVNADESEDDLPF